MLGAEQIPEITKEILDALLKVGSAGLPLAAALGSSFATVLAVAEVSRPACVASLADGSENKEKAQVKGKDDCE